MWSLFHVVPHCYKLFLIVPHCSASSHRIYNMWLMMSGRCSRWRWRCCCPSRVCKRGCRESLCWSRRSGRRWTTRGSSESSTRRRSRWTSASLWVSIQSTRHYARICTIVSIHPVNEQTLTHIDSAPPTSFIHLYSPLFTANLIQSPLFNRAYPLILQCMITNHHLSHVIWNTSPQTSTLTYFLYTIETQLSYVLKDVE